MRHRVAVSQRRWLVKRTVYLKSQLLEKKQMKMKMKMMGVYSLAH